jgi:hypothetical protein
MMLTPLLSPIGRYLAFGLVAAALCGAIVLKIRHDAQAALLIKIEREKNDAIIQAQAARERLRDLCRRNLADCLSDDWFRD